jgi:hypothetical protein
MPIASVRSQDPNTRATHSADTDGSGSVDRQGLTFMMASSAPTGKGVLLRSEAEPANTPLVETMPAAPNPARASQFQVGHHWRGVGEPDRSAKSSNAKGVPSQSPGLPRSGYPGFTGMTSPSTPTGLCPERPTRLDSHDTPRTQPRWGWGRICGTRSQGSASAAQPWAGGRNAVGVRRDGCCGLATNAEPVAPHEPPPASRISRARVFERWIRSRHARTAAVGERGR